MMSRLAGSNFPFLQLRFISVAPIEPSFNRCHGKFLIWSRGALTVKVLQIRGTVKLGLTVFLVFPVGDKNELFKWIYQDRTGMYCANSCAQGIALFWGILSPPDMVWRRQNAPHKECSQNTQEYK